MRKETVAAEVIVDNHRNQIVDDVAMTVQDHAYTSPIWYTP